jgi:hypothetical protein
MNYIVKNKQELELCEKLITDNVLDFCGNNIETIKINSTNEIIVKLSEFTHPVNFILKLPIQEIIELRKNYKTIYFKTDKYILEFPISYEYELKSKNNG